MNIKPPKIVVIGAGSAIFGLGALSTMLQSEKLRGAHLALCDIDEPGLATITKLATIMNETWGAGMTIRSSTERRDLLPGADFVIVSIQVGQRETVWEMDWQIPLRHGVRQPYAENGGPGSFSHTARNLPVLLAIARDMEELCPDAYYLNLVNPLIRLTTAVHRYSKIKVVGLCHQLLWGWAMAGTVLAERFNIPVPEHFHVHTDADNMPAFIPVARAAVDNLDIKAAGINHFSWVYDIRDKRTGEDLYPELRETWLKHYRKDFEPLSREIFDIYGMMPTAGDSHMCEYLTCVSDPRTQPWEKYELKLQSWEGNRRRRAARKALAEAIVSGKTPVDDLRDVWRHQMLDEGIPEMVAAVHFNQQHYHPQLNIPNRGYIPNLPDDAIVEVPGMISAFGFQGLAFPPLPDGIAEMCRRELALSSLIVDACFKGDRGLALQAMLLDPMVTDIDTARAILDDLLKSFAEYLPQFA
jgi:alpha-galactosidase